MASKKISRGEAIKAELRRELQRKDLLEFVIAQYNGPGKYVPERFHRVLCDKLMWFSEEIAAGREPFLIIEAPPRHGKSVIVSQIWPVWHMGRYPGHGVVLASYADKLAADHSTKAREYAVGAVRSGVFKGLAPDQPWTDRKWMTKSGSEYMCCGMGGSVTGLGGHIMAVDDYTKNIAEAMNATKRQKDWEWWQETYTTRAAPGGGWLIMATRWNADDLIGRAKSDPKIPNPTVLRLPAIAEDDRDPEDWREPGEALCPVRWPADRLETRKRLVGTRGWLAQFQQRPTPEDGDIFKSSWFKSHTLNPWSTQWDDSLISVDCTFKALDSSDYVVMQAWGRIGANFYLLGQLREKMSFTETVKALLRFVGRHSYTNGVLVEDKANGTAVMDTLRNTIPGLVPVEPKGGKVSRAIAISWCYEAGNVYHPAEPWVSVDLEPEMSNFPAGKHDDQVDCISQVLARWTSDVKTGDDAVEEAFAGLLDW